jgi:hypothetical protein
MENINVNQHKDQLLKDEEEGESCGEKNNFAECNRIHCS